MSDKLNSIAVLIDADNASPKNIGHIIQQIEKLGNIRCKKIYGDWGNVHIQSWQEALLKYAIEPMQQFAYAKGKNATDIGMVIEAMDLLYSGNYDGFCLISSDSDFTSLAIRIRKSGIKVFGFGKRNTVDAFTHACDQFFYVEDLIASASPKIAAGPKTADSHNNVTNSKTSTNETQKTATTTTSDATTRWTTKQLHTKNHLISVLNKLIKEDPKSADGWSNISYIASKINQHHENIKLDKYGYKKFSDLITALRLYDMRRESNKILIKIKTKKVQPNPTSTTTKPITQSQNNQPVSENKNAKSNPTTCFPATALKVQITSAPSVDVVLFRLASNGKVRGDEDMIFYGQTHSEDGSIILDQQIDDLTSVSEFGCDLRAQPTAIQQFAFALSSELSSMTTDPRQPVIQLTIDDQLSNLCLFSDDFDISQKTGKSLLLFTLARLDKPSQAADQWQFVPKHQNIEGDLRALCEQYGVEISDE